jgi:hypothetical protein
MKNLLASVRPKVNNNLKSLARYYNIPTNPTSVRKPMYPLDNLDPGRKDLTMVDEYDKWDIINLGLKETFRQVHLLLMLGKEEKSFQVIINHIF